MARSLNKKYFGNRNVGTNGTSDDKIGGEGIASINWSNYGSWLSTAGGASAPLAGLALPAPTLPNGVQATWTNYFGAAAVTTGAGKAGLVTGNTYEYAPIPGLVVTVGSLAGTNALFTVTAPGSTTDLLTDLQTVNLTRLTGAGAATFAVDIQLKIVNTVINEKGSGYTGNETFTVTKVNGATGTAPAGTIVLTTDTGDVGSSTNQENAIVAYAYIGGSRKVVDIVSQKGARRYKVTDGTDTEVCTLQTAGNSNADGEMDITAVDSDGGEYWVLKLNNRRATLVVKGVGGGSQFATGASVPWTFDSPTQDVSVQIANA